MAPNLDDLYFFDVVNNLYIFYKLFIIIIYYFIMYLLETLALSEAEPFISAAEKVELDSWKRWLHCDSANALIIC